MKGALMNRNALPAIAVIAVLSLSACGGGDSSGSQPPIAVRAKVAARNDLQLLKKAVRTGIAFIQAIITSPKSVLLTERITP